SAGTKICRARHAKASADAQHFTGFHGSVTDGMVISIFDAVNSSKATVFSLDMPSGTNADTGAVSENSICANTTIAFAAPKIGQFIFPAADCCGKVAYVGIGISESAYKVHGDKVELLDFDIIKSKIPSREKNSNKGSYGKVLCICGSLGMAGAAYLCASGALRSGAGLITVLVPKSVYVPVASKLNECMVYPLESTEDGSISHNSYEFIIKKAESASAIIVGCGLSQNPETQQLIREIVVNAKCPIILDADGINAFNGHIDLLRTSSAELILTPHPGEMSRLCGKTIEQIQQSRLDTARSFAAENGLTLVLKGANTIIAAKDGRAFLNPTGNPGMAKGGSGDILAGMIGSFTAQGMMPIEAACCGTFLHGLAGDKAAEKLSQYGMIPTDMLMEVPQIFREMSR
ncbi:MAG TPA: NAD(P)H-hydrate dehydratase, partial [Ruminiclostridium sp.]|nr:NAD(P)H-hydrate dehydratase [Ruminiclostridium sp.]